MQIRLSWYMKKNHSLKAEGRKETQKSPAGCSSRAFQDNGEG
jgi:hypothetical protein